MVQPLSHAEQRRLNKEEKRVRDQKHKWARGARGLAGAEDGSEGIRPGAIAHAQLQ